MYSAIQLLYLLWVLALKYNFCIFFFLLAACSFFIQLLYKLWNTIIKYRRLFLYNNWISSFFYTIFVFSYTIAIQSSYNSCICCTTAVQLLYNSLYYLKYNNVRCCTTRWYLFIVYRPVFFECASLAPKPFEIQTWYWSRMKDFLKIFQNDLTENS